MTRRVPHGAGPACSGTALVFLGRQRRKNNRRSDRVRNGKVFAACAFLGKTRKPFLPPNAGGEGLKPHGRTASTGEAERGPEPGARCEAEPGARCAPDVQTLLPPKAGLGRSAPPDPPPAPLGTPAAEGLGLGGGQATGLGQLSQSQSVVICSPEQQKSNR